MTKANKSISGEKEAYALCQDRIIGIAKQEYGGTPRRLRTLLRDVAVSEGHDMDVLTILVNLIGSVLGNTLAFQL